MTDSLLDFEDERVRMVAWEQVGICTWYDAPQMDQLRAMRRFTHGLHERYPQGFGFVDLIVRGTPRFSNEVRVEAADVARESGRWSLGTVHIILLEGFAGAAVRGFVSTMVLLARSKEVVRVFGSIAEGVDFLVERMGERAPDRDAFIALLEHERDQGPPAPGGA